MSKAAELAALIGSQTALSNRNLIINGAMQVSQRGTSFASIASNTYTLDRWQLQAAGAGRSTITQSTTVPNNNFVYSMKVDVTTADTSLATTDLQSFTQRMEGNVVSQIGLGTSSAKSFTVSFWVRSNKTGTYCVSIRNVSGTRSIASEYSISSADTWEHKEVTFSGDTTGSYNTGNAEAFNVNFVLLAGTNYDGKTANTWEANTNFATDNQVNLFDSTSNDWYITGVQLEVGEQATPFEHWSFAEEWDRCQRYCTVYNVGGGNTHGQNLVSPNHTVPGAAAHVDVGNRAEWFMSYPVKRSQPTITVTDPTNMRWLANGNVVVDANGSVTFPVGTGHQNANVFQGVPSSISTSSVPEGWLYKGSGTNPVITIDAEL